MNSIHLSAIKKATRIRNSLELDMFEPLNIYDTCERSGISVRVVSINMEGIYIKSNEYKKPTILLSNERPFPRRVFTCAHEFGHHTYNHGSKIDTLNYNKGYTLDQDQEELLVNVFASALLMPVAGIEAEFAKRELNPNEATPLQIFGISSYFGVGYQTLIYHCKANRVISFLRAKTLLKHTPSKILTESFSKQIELSHFKYFDDFSLPKIIDFEKSNYLIIPSKMNVDGNYLREVGRTNLGVVYKTQKQGVTQVTCHSTGKSSTIRIENKNYMGLSKYRHLE